MAFVPRVDVEREFPFLPDTPERLVANKQFNQVPYIGGLTENEGGLFAASKFNLSFFQLSSIAYNLINWF